MRALPVALLLSLALLGCTGEAAEPEPVDLRREFPEPGEGVLVLNSPEYVIPPGVEQQWCWITTYDGPDMAIISQVNYQSLNGHHIVIFGTSTPEHQLADGEQWDCTETEQLDMTSMDPILIGGSIRYDDDGVVNEFVLPEGMGATLQSGTRIILQSHYINVRDEPILVRDAAYLELVPEEEIVTWTAPFVNTILDFTIPAGSDEYSLSFECGWDETFELLYIGGHLHEWGLSFRTDHTNAAGVVQTIYEVEEWEPVLRDAPLYTPFEPGEFVVTPGDTFTTHCTWFNHEEEDLEFPQEMCVTFGMAYPSRVPIICDGG
jgi:hypothetical protein